MPMMQVPAADDAITAATALGVISVTANAAYFPGTNAWVYKTDGSLNYRVLIVKLVSTTGMQVRRYPDDNEAKPAGYGFTDMSGFNSGSRISAEAQLAPYDPAYSKHQVP